MCLNSNFLIRYLHLVLYIQSQAWERKQYYKAMTSALSFSHSSYTHIRSTCRRLNTVTVLRGNLQGILQGIQINCCEGFARACEGFAKTWQGGGVRGCESKSF
jgi:hypothetical protein